MKQVVLFTVYCSLITSSFAAMLPPALQWDVDLRRPDNYTLPLYRGETINLEPRFYSKIGTLYIIPTNAVVELRYRPVAWSTNSYYQLLGSVHSDTGRVTCTWTAASESTNSTYDYTYSVTADGIPVLRCNGKITLADTVGGNPTNVPTAVSLYIERPEFVATNQVIVSRFTNAEARVTALEDAYGTGAVATVTWTGGLTNSGTATDPVGQLAAATSNSLVLADNAVQPSDDWTNTIAGVPAGDITNYPALADTNGSAAAAVAAHDALTGSAVHGLDGDLAITNDTGEKIEVGGFSVATARLAYVGDRSFAMGAYPSALGQWSFAGGYRPDAPDNRAFVWGGGTSLYTSHGDGTINLNGTSIWFDETCIWSNGSLLAFATAAQGAYADAWHSASGTVLTTTSKLDYSNITNPPTAVAISRYAARVTSGSEIYVTASATGITAVLSGATATFTIPAGVIPLTAQIRVPSGSGTTLTLEMGTNWCANTDWADRWGMSAVVYREDTGALIPSASTRLLPVAWTEGQVLGLVDTVVSRVCITFQ